MDLVCSTRFFNCWLYFDAVFPDISSSSTDRKWLYPASVWRIFLKSESEKSNRKHWRAWCTVSVYLWNYWNYIGDVYDIFGREVEKGHSYFIVESDDDSGSYHCDFFYSALWREWDFDESNSIRIAFGTDSV